MQRKKGKEMKLKELKDLITVTTLIRVENKQHNRTLFQGECGFLGNEFDKNDIHSIYSWWDEKRIIISLDIA
jgi:hypothetical protein